MLMGMMWSIHLSPFCLCHAGYATQKASWIPSSEREKLIPVPPLPPPRAPTALDPVVLLTFHQQHAPNLTPVISQSRLSPHRSTHALAVKGDNSSQISFSGSFTSPLTLFITCWLGAEPHGYGRSCPRDRCSGQPTTGKKWIEKKYVELFSYLFGSTYGHHQYCINPGNTC